MINNICSIMRSFLLRFLFIMMMIFIVIGSDDATTDDAYNYDDAYHADDVYYHADDVYYYDDDAYNYDDNQNSGLIISKYWKTNVIIVFTVLCAFTWIMDMLAICNKYIHSKAVFANFRMKQEELMLGVSNDPNDPNLLKIPLSKNMEMNDTLENDLRPVIETRKNLFMIPYDYYNYCGFYDKSLLSRRLYYTGDFKTDFILFLFNYNAFLSMFASVPEHPFSRSHRRLQFLYYHGIALSLSFIVGYALIDEPRETLIYFNIFFMSPFLFVLKYSYYLLVTCPCLVGNNALKTYLACLCRNYQALTLIIGYCAGLFGLFLLVVVGAIFVETEDGSASTKKILLYGKKLVFDYQMAVFVTSTGNEIIVALLEFNVFTGHSLKTPVMHIGRWQYEKEYYNSEKYAIDYKKTFSERMSEAYEGVRNTLHSIKNVFGSFEGSKDPTQKVKDISNSKLLSYVGKDKNGNDFLRESVSSLRESTSEKADSFRLKFLKALIPSPEMVGNTLSGAIIGKREADKNIKGEWLDEASTVDRLTHAKASGKRASATAQKCTFPDCNTIHFFPTGLCAKHNGIGSKTERNTLVTSTSGSSTSSTRIEDYRADKVLSDHYAVLSQLRSEMLELAQTLDVTDISKLQLEATKQLKGVDGTSSLSEIEQAQLLDQFKRLAGKGSIISSPIITSSSLVNWLQLVDPAYAKRNQVEEEVQKWLELFINETYPSNSKGMDFALYCQTICAYRKKEATVIKELNRYAFTDLRFAYLSVPTSKPKLGWLAKRGYFFAQENLNTWFMRYFVVEDHKLKYYTGEPGKVGSDGKVVTQPCNEINLLDIAIVDFSPKTLIPISLDQKFTRSTAFKITTFSGKRMTISGSREEVISWVAYLSGYVNASRAASEFKEQFGTKRTESKTIRDYVMFGAIICKIQEGKKYVAKNGEESVNDIEFMEKYELNDDDYFYLKLFNPGEKSKEQLRNEAEALATTLLDVIKRWNSVQGYIQQADTLLTGGTVIETTKSIVLAVQYTINGYLFAAAAKNRFYQNKFGVKWVSKMSARNCAVCKALFKSVSLRKAMRKHHCRSCGRVVCMPCSPSKIEMKVSDKPERICTECLGNGGIPPMSCLEKNQSMSIAEFLFTSINNAANAAITEDEDVEDNDQSDDDEDKSENPELGFN